MYRSIRIVYLLCAGFFLMLSFGLAGCQKQQETQAVSGSVPEQAGAPPAPNDLSPEIKERIAKEQAQFQERSRQQQQQATAPGKSK